VGPLGNRDDRLTAEQHESQLVAGMAVLVRDEVVEELISTLLFVDAPDVQQVRRVTQTELRAERRGVDVRTGRVDTDADHLTGRLAVEPRAEILALHVRRQRKGVGRPEYLVEQREVQARLVVRRGMQHERNAAGEYV